jgi:hypothetical protein
MNSRIAVSQLPQHIKTACGRHGQIKQEHLRTVFMNASDGFVPVACLPNDREPAWPLERGPKSVAEYGESVGNDDSHGG